MTQEDFMKNILGNAQRLCSPEGDARINSKKVNAPTSKAAVDPESFGGAPVSSSQDAAWDRMFLSEAAYEDNGPAAPAKAPQMRPITQASASKSRVPDFIKESMMSNSIDTTALSDNPLDRMDLSRFQKNPAPAPARQQVNETVAPQQTGGIDYPLIRAIINECIENKLKEYGLTKVGNLNESTLKSIHLKGGTINLIDNSGNIYSAKLTKTGNLNEGKK